jgi:hypothetical protein
MHAEECPKVVFRAKFKPGKAGKGHTSIISTGEVDLTYNRLLLCLTVIAYFLVQADASPSMLMKVESLGIVGSMGDPLDPSQLGESMSMPLPQELIQEAEKAGVITKSNPLYKPDSERQPGLTQPEADEDNSLDNVNVTGAWSFDLNGTTLEQMKLYLVQNKDLIKGQGVMNRGNRTENATASGSIFGDKMCLNVMPVGVSELYELNLSLSSLDSGTYTDYLADGSSRSGEVTFAVSSNIFLPASTD